MVSLNTFWNSEEILNKWFPDEKIRRTAPTSFEPSPTRFDFNVPVFDTGTIRPKLIQDPPDPLLQSTYNHGYFSGNSFFRPPTAFDVVGLTTTGAIAYGARQGLHLFQI